MKNKLGIFTLALAATCAGMTSTAQAVLTDFKDTDTIGSNGWYSGDSRDAANNNLVGQNNSHEAGGTLADDATIEELISYNSSTPGVLAGSLNGEGTVRLWSTDSNNGKAHLSVRGSSPASFLLSDDFEASIRYFNEPLERPGSPVGGTSRAIGISIGVEYNGIFYSFSHTNPNNVLGWNENTVTADTGEWRLFSQGTWAGAYGDPDLYLTLEQWASVIAVEGPNNYNIGDVLNNGNIVEIGFNLGSYQRWNYTYVDWFSSTALNYDDNGDLTVMGAPSSPVVPEPATAGLLALGLVAAAARRRRA